MIRCSSHTLKFTNKDKLNLIHRLQSDYKIALQECIDLILNKKLSYKWMLSSKDIPTLNGIAHSIWKQVIYKNTIEIIKSNLKKTKNKTYKRYQKVYHKFAKNNKHQTFLNKRYSELHIDYLKRIPKIIIKESSINLNHMLFNINQDITQEFDKFIQIRLPYFRNKRRAITVNIPIKEHKHSLKFKNWKLKNTIKLYKNNLIFFHEKEDKIKKIVNNRIGIDIGYKKLMTTSSNHFYGKKMIKVYNKLNRQ